MAGLKYQARCYYIPFSDFDHISDYNLECMYNNFLNRRDGKFLTFPVKNFGWNIFVLCLKFFQNFSYFL